MAVECQSGMHAWWCDAENLCLIGSRTCRPSVTDPAGAVYQDLDMAGEIVAWKWNDTGSRTRSHKQRLSLMKSVEPPASLSPTMQDAWTRSQAVERIPCHVTMDV